MPVHIFDIELAKEWFGTCGEYAGFLKKPFQDVPLKNLWKCSQDDWEKAFKEWTLMNFYFGVLIHVVANLFYALSAGIGTYLITAIINICYNIFLTYLFSHMGWFAVVKKGSCCGFCFICVTDVHVMNLIWGLWLCFYGVMMALGGLTMLGYVSSIECALCLVSAILYFVYAVVWIYMGVCCLRIWKAKGSEIMPANLEVKGPPATVVPAPEQKPGTEEMA